VSISRIINTVPQSQWQ